PGTSPEVAVKCDLCRGLGHGPACVSACPTSAIVRVNPNEALPELRQALGAGPAAIDPLPRPAPAFSAWLAAAVFGPALAVRPAPGAGSASARYATGALAGALLVASAAYGVVKRVRRARRADSTLRPRYVAHVALGVLCAGAAKLHGGASPPENAAGAL